MSAVVFPTLLQIRTRVRFFIDELTQANFSDSDLNYAINNAQQKVATEISLVDEDFFVATTPTIVTTTAGNRFYPLASDCWMVIRLEDFNTGLQINFGRFADQDNFYNGIIPPIVTSSTIGYSASIVGNSIAITPTPSGSNIKAQYWYVPILPDMTSDSDVSAIPRAFIDLLAVQASIDAKIKDEDDTTALAGMYSSLFNQLVRGTRTRQQQNPRGVTRVSGDGYQL